MNVSVPAVMTLPRLLTYAIVTGPDDCWEWQLTRTEYGYGRVRVGGRSGRLHRAHRLAYELANDVVLTSSQVVMHTCDNPPCINPAHLSVGTQADNIADRDRKGHGWWTK